MFPTFPFNVAETASLDIVETATSGIAVFSFKLIFNVVVDTVAVVVVIVGSGVTVVIIDGGLFEDRDGANNVGPTLFDDGESKE